MGDTTVRYFRDKLAMRLKAREHGISAPDFVHVLNYDRIREFMGRVPRPWALKPRFEVSTVGLTKMNSQEERWPPRDLLGDRQCVHLSKRHPHGHGKSADSVAVESWL